jgi:NADH-quinone oxidoreductase subunit E
VTLRPAALEEIRRAAASLPNRKAACIDALRIVQEHHGWVSDELVLEVARLLGMDPTEVDAVSTFYNLIYRRPVGTHVILCCDSVSCWIMGAERLHRALQEKLAVSFGQTTADGRFTLLPIACLGACDRAPALMIDGELHGSVEASRLPVLLEEHDG